MTVTLIAPIAMEEGLRFAIREGGRTVGAGVVDEDHRVTSKSEPLLFAGTADVTREASGGLRFSCKNDYEEPTLCERLFKR